MATVRHLKNTTVSGGAGAIVLGKEGPQIVSVNILEPIASDQI